MIFFILFFWKMIYKDIFGKYAFYKNFFFFFWKKDAWWNQGIHDFLERFLNEFLNNSMENFYFLKKSLIFEKRILFCF